jgi:3-phenylpropionate/trans-cinnamate dioxygenase ferredoxin subunit
MTDEFVPVAKVAELAPGQMKWVAIEGNRLVLANVEGSFYALRDVCGHRNAPLSRGKLQGYLIECPLHFAEFDVRTGELVNGPVSTGVPVYEVRVEGGTVYVRG